MHGVADYVPFSEKQLIALARAVGVSTDLIWINPLTGAVQLREWSGLSPASGLGVENLADDVYTSQQ